MKKISDEELIKKFQKNDDRKALGTLFKRHRVIIYGYIMSKVKGTDAANDVYQEANYRVIKSLTKREYNYENKFINWYTVIAGNCCIDHFRDRFHKKISTAPLESYNFYKLLSDYELNAEQKFVLKEFYERLFEIIESLSEVQQYVVKRRMEGVAFDDIAEEAGGSINTWLARFRYAMINIRKKL